MTSPESARTNRTRWPETSTIAWPAPQKTPSVPSGTGKERWRRAGPVRSQIWTCPSAVRRAAWEPEGAHAHAAQSPLSMALSGVTFGRWNSVRSSMMWTPGSAAVITTASRDSAPRVPQCRDVLKRSRDGVLSRTPIGRPSVASRNSTPSWETWARWRPSGLHSATQPVSAYQVGRPVATSTTNAPPRSRQYSRPPSGDHRGVRSTRSSSFPISAGSVSGKVYSSDSGGSKITPVCNGTTHPWTPVRPSVPMATKAHVPSGCRPHAGGRGLPSVTWASARGSLDSPNGSQTPTAFVRKAMPMCRASADHWIVPRSPGQPTPPSISGRVLTHLPVAVSQIWRAP